MLLGAKANVKEKLNCADAAAGVATTTWQQTLRSERDGQHRRNAPQPTRQQLDEVAFLEQGLREVQRTAQIVYTENMDLRARIELLRLLTAKLTLISGLPEDVQAELQTVLEGALPPRGVLNPDSHYEFKTDAVDVPVGSCERSSTCGQKGRSPHAFAAQLRELCKAMDQYDLKAESNAKPHSEGNESSDARTSHTTQAHAGSCNSTTLALTEYGEDLWQRTRHVCYELVDGWF